MGVDPCLNVFSPYRGDEGGLGYQYRALAKERALTKDELKAQAEQDQKTYDALN